MIRSCSQRRGRIQLELEVANEFFGTIPIKNHSSQGRRPVQMKNPATAKIRASADQIILLEKLRLQRELEEFERWWKRANHSRIKFQRA